MANNMIAMILAGGRGSRLFELTKKVAKPAVYFGGKYRIIDFPLSNCANSKIYTVGVLTQYENIILNSYVSRGHYWGFNSNNGGIFVLPPREKDQQGLQVYSGTADAITQNLDFLDQEEPEYVLILSGDHIYKMDYDKMLNFHKANNAVCTIAVIQVPLEEANRFGIMTTDDDDQIVRFDEKPENPQSDLASMGIYIFNYKELKKALLLDEDNKTSDHDFGKDIIPYLVKQNKKCMAYRFSGYWKDVGTLESLWEANLDLLKEDNDLNLGDNNWKIYTENANAFPQIIGKEANISNCYINQGSYIEGTVINSVICGGVEIKKGAIVKNSVIMPNVIIESDAKLDKCIVQEHTTVKKDQKIGSSKGITLVHNRGVREDF